MEGVIGEGWEEWRERGMVRWKGVRKGDERGVMDSECIEETEMR